MKKFLTMIVFSGIAASFMAGNAYGQCPDYRGNGGYYYDDDRSDYGYSDRYGYQDRRDDRDQSRSMRSGRQADQNQRNQAQDNQSDRQNQQLRNDIQDFLSDYENVKFTLNNGVVTLRGTVSSDQDKKDIEEEIRDMDGVKQVKNQIQVQKAQRDQQSQRNNNQQMQH